MNERKGIVLAGGSGTRLYPVTLAVSKHLLPVYDKPMIYYPISVLMLAGIRDIAVITTNSDQNMFERLLGDGSQWGVKFSYIAQDKPEGIAQAYVLTEEFLAGAPSAMILGDNIFFGHGMPSLLKEATQKETGCTIFGYHVTDPERYGVIEFDDKENILSIEEKPKDPKSNYAITGLYFMDAKAPMYAKTVQKSSRGEFEIVDLLDQYRCEAELSAQKMSRGYAWLDTGTCSSLLDAGNYVRTLTERQGLQVGSPDEVAFQLGYINSEQILTRSEMFKKNTYGTQLSKLYEALKIK